MCLTDLVGKKGIWCSWGGLWWQQGWWWCLLAPVQIPLKGWVGGNRLQGPSTHLCTTTYQGRQINCDKVLYLPFSWLCWKPVFLLPLPNGAYYFKELHREQVSANFSIFPHYQETPSEFSGCSTSSHPTFSQVDAQLGCILQGGSLGMTPALPLLPDSSHPTIRVWFD